MMLNPRYKPHIDTAPPHESPVVEESPSKTSIINDSPKKATGWRRVLGYVWDTFDEDPEEGRFVRKVDYFLFSYIMLGYFIKYLDQQNYYTINIRWIQCCELAWSFLVMAMAGAKNSQTALRFFVGLLESCSFPGYAALLGSWYGPTQLAKRVALFEQSSALASMFSRYLQAALYTGMNGKSGLKGWQWLFIFDAIISIPIAVWGYFTIPDHPSTTRAFWLKKKDREFAVQREAKMGRAPAAKLTWRKLRKIYTGMVAQAGQGSGYFNPWLKDQGYSTAEVNTVPTAGNALSMVASLFFGTIADRTGTRADTCIVVCLIVIISNITLSIWNIPRAGLLFAFFLSFVSAAAQPLIIAWGQDVTQSNAEFRQMLVATGNIFTYTFWAWIPLVLFPTYDAPVYKYGYQVLILFGGLAIVGVWLFGYLDKWDRKKKAARAVSDQEGAV
ncbi:major facilitator superfamily domain-containing protein [Aspergillus crustosus]